MLNRHVKCGQWQTLLSSVFQPLLDLSKDQICVKTWQKTLEEQLYLLRQMKQREWANRDRRWGKESKEMGDEQRTGGKQWKRERIMSHLQDKNSTVAVVFLLRNALRGQHDTVKQGARQNMSLLQCLDRTVYVSICMYLLYICATVLYLWLDFSGLVCWSKVIAAAAIRKTKIQF